MFTVKSRPCRDGEIATGPTFYTKEEVVAYVDTACEAAIAEDMLEQRIGWEWWLKYESGHFWIEKDGERIFSWEA